MTICLPYILTYTTYTKGENMTEAEIQSQILLELSKRGHRLWRSNFKKGVL